MKILVTGSDGFIGGHLVKYLIDRNYDIVCLQKSTNIFKGVNTYIGDLVNNQYLDEVMLIEKPDLCIHCAGSSSVQFSIDFPYEDFSKTVLTTRNLLEAIRVNSNKTKLLFLSSAAVYGNQTSNLITEDTQSSPISPYGFNKLTAENLILQYEKVYGVQSTILRIFSVYGNGLKRQVIYDVFRKLLDDTDEEIRLFGTGKESRDFIHISEVIAIIDIIIKKDLNGLYNLASGNSIEIKDLAGIIKEEIGSNKRIHFEGFVKVGDPLNWSVDIRKIRNEGFTPKVSLREGIKEYYDWLRQEIT